MFTAVGHSIDSVSESTVHLTEPDYCLITRGGQIFIVGLTGITLFLVWFLPIWKIACEFNRRSIEFQSGSDSVD